MRAANVDYFHAKISAMLIEFSSVHVIFSVRHVPDIVFFCFFFRSGLFSVVCLSQPRREVIREANLAY